MKINSINNKEHCMGLNNNERIELHCHTCGSRMNGTAGSTDIFRYARQ